MEPILLFFHLFFFPAILFSYLLCLILWLVDCLTHSLYGCKLLYTNMTSEHTYISHLNVNQIPDHAITLFYASYTVPMTRHCIWDYLGLFGINRQ